MFSVHCSQEHPECGFPTRLHLHNCKGPVSHTALSPPARCSAIPHPCTLVPLGYSGGPTTILGLKPTHSRCACPPSPHLSPCFPPTPSTALAQSGPRPPFSHSNMSNLALPLLFPGLLSPISSRLSQDRIIHHRGLLFFPFTHIPPVTPTPHPFSLPFKQHPLTPHQRPRAPSSPTHTHELGSWISLHPNSRPLLPPLPTL